MNGGCFCHTRKWLVVEGANARPGEEDEGSNSACSWPCGILKKAGEDKEAKEISQNSSHSLLSTRTWTQAIRQEEHAPTPFWTKNSRYHLRPKNLRMRRLEGLIGRRPNQGRPEYWKRRLRYLDGWNPVSTPFYRKSAINCLEMFGRGST